MVPIHPANVIRLLMTTFLLENNNETPINNRKMELHDIIKDMLIKSQEDTSFSMEADVTLEFLEPFRPHSVEFVDDIYCCEHPMDGIHGPLVLATRTRAQREEGDRNDRLSSCHL